ncbi:MAG: glycosyltransferase family 2 protein [Deltaproteobacteria bacterium]|nr:glycosyltransferase family 2 protein [Deltaproteobacteria bacterium]
MKNSPKVSVIILNFNGKHHLKDCFESLYAQDFPFNDMELILADNGSNDGSVEFVKKKFPEVNTIEFKENLGFAEGNNRAAKKAKGDIIAFMNNDMRAHPLWLKNLVENLDLNKGIVATSSKILNWDGNKIDFIGGVMTPFGHGYQPRFGEKSSKVKDDTKEIFFPCGGAMAIYKNFFLEIGGFDPDFFAYFEDVDLGWRIWLFGEKVLFVPDSVVYHRHLATGGLLAHEKRSFLYERNALFTIFKNYEDFRLSLYLPAALLMGSAKNILTSTFSFQEFYIGPKKDEEKSPKKESPWAKKKRNIKTIIKEKDFKAPFRWLVLQISRIVLKMIGYHPVPRYAFVFPAAAYDFIFHLNTFMKKRRWIQSNRKKSDEEIFSFFKLENQFHPDLNPDYIIIIEKLIKVIQDITKEKKKK